MSCGARRGSTHGGGGGVSHQPPRHPPFTLPYLTPHQHGAEDDLQPIEEVVADDDDGGTSGGPALAGADGFDAGGGCFGREGRDRAAVSVGARGAGAGDAGVGAGGARLGERRQRGRAEAESENQAAARAGGRQTRVATDARTRMGMVRESTCRGRTGGWRVDRWKEHAQDRQTESK